jgi:hypothetical protein
MVYSVNHSQPRAVTVITSRCCKKHHATHLDGLARVTAQEQAQARAAHNTPALAAGSQKQAQARATPCTTIHPPTQPTNLGINSHMRCT